jgi:hypothetical protein
MAAEVFMCYLKHTVEHASPCVDGISDHPLRGQSLFSMFYVCN